MPDESIFGSPEDDEAFFTEFLSSRTDAPQAEYDPTAEEEPVNVDALPPKRVSTDGARRAYFRLPELPEGYQLHHLCGNPWCRNPDHLIAVTLADHQKIHGKRSYCER